MAIVWWLKGGAQVWAYPSQEPALVEENWYSGLVVTGIGMCVCICVYRCLYVHVGACACMHVTCVWIWMRICVCCICYVWMCLHVWVALNINLHPHERANIKHWSIKEKNMGNPNAKNHKHDNITCINPPPPNKKTNSRVCTVLVPKGFKTKKPNLLIFFIQIFMKFTCDVTDSSPYSIIQPYHAQRNFLKSRLMKSEFITFLCFSFPCGSVFLQRGSSLLQLD